jgi:hypothetical protein
MAEMCLNILIANSIIWFGGQIELVKQGEMGQQNISLHHSVSVSMLVQILKRQFREIPLYTEPSHWMSKGRI